MQRDNYLDSIPQWELSCPLLLDSSNQDLQILYRQISHHYTHAIPCMVHQLVKHTTSSNSRVCYTSCEQPALHVRAVLSECMCGCSAIWSHALLLLVQLTVNMCTCPENSNGAHKDEVWSSTLTEGMGTWGPSNKRCKTSMLALYTYMKTEQLLPDLTAARSFSRIVLQALKDEWPQRMVGR